MLLNSIQFIRKISTLLSWQNSYRYIIDPFIDPFIQIDKMYLSTKYNTAYTWWDWFKAKRSIMEGKYCTCGDLFWNQLGFWRHLFMHIMTCIKKHACHNIIWRIQLSMEVNECTVGSIIKQPYFQRPKAEFAKPHVLFNLKLLCFCSASL